MRGARSVATSLVLAATGLAGALIALVAIEIGLRSREDLRAAEALQAEMAASAAGDVRQFIAEIETAMRSSAQSAADAARGLSWLFREELLDLLKVAPAVTSVSALDVNGMEVARVARDEFIDQTDLRDQSASVAFQRARTSEVFYGRPMFVGDSILFLTIGLPIEWFEGEIAGVLVAEVDLRDLSAVVARLSDERGTIAYVVSGMGDLIAHPEFSRVLQGADLSGLDQVRAVIADEPIPFESRTGIEGARAYAKYGRVDDLDWAVLIERPAEAVLAPISVSRLRVFLGLAVALVLLAAFGILLKRRVIQPLAALAAGANRTREGRYDLSVVIETGDEFQAIAAAINDMAARWHRLDSTLATQVDFRRNELGAALLEAASFAQAYPRFLEAGSRSDNVEEPRLNIGETIALLERARSDTPGNETRLAVAIETALCRAYAMAGRPLDALQAYLRAVAGAEKLADNWVLLNPLLAILAARAWPELLAARLEAGSRALDLSKSQQVDVALGDLIAWHFTDLVETGRVTEARAIAKTADRLGSDGGDELLRLRATHMELLLAAQAGIGPSAEEEIEAARDRGISNGLQAADRLYVLQMAAVRRERAQSGDAVQLIERRLQAGGSRPCLRALLALLKCDQGSFPDARHDFEQLATAGFNTIPRDEEWVIAVGFIAEACAKLEDSSRAVALHQLLEPYGGRNLVGEVISLGAADRYLGMLAATRGDWEAAVSRYESALALNELSEAPVWRDHTVLDLATALLARHGPGDQERAGALVEEALRSAAELGLARLREDALSVLSQKPGVGPAADGLSPAELRVLRLLASGATNRAIGEKLFVSQHTVANHVRNILAKTNTGNRIEAANYARRHNLIADEKGVSSRHQ